MPKNLIIDKELCIGLWNMFKIYLNMFELNESIEKANIKNQETCSQCDCEEAINSCPVGAISWKEK